MSVISLDPRRRPRPQFLSAYGRIWVFGLAQTAAAILTVRLILGLL
jgi:hypothetical protein